MSDWVSWSTRAGVSEDPLRENFQVLPDTKAHESDANSHWHRNRVRVEWKWGGLDAATALWHTMTYRADLVALATAAASGTALLTKAAPVAGASYIMADNFDANAQGLTLYKGWHFMVWPDPTIYTLTEDVVVSEVDYIFTTKGTTPGWLALDLYNTPNRIYYTDYGNEQIRRCELDGANDTLLVTLTDLKSICIDAAAGYIYYTHDSKVLRRNLDGTGALELTSFPPTAQTRGICIDTTSSPKRLYYVVHDGTSQINGMDVDGTNNAAIYSGIVNVWDVAVDATEATPRLYWTNFGAVQIQSGNVDGTDLQTPITANAGSCVEVDPVNGHIYWTHNSTSMVYRANLDGTNVEALALVANEPHGIALDVANGTMYFNEHTVKNYYSLPLYGGPSAAQLNVTPVVTAAAAAAGDNAPLHFFVPKDVAAPWSQHPEGYQARITEEFVTAYQRVYQAPE